MAESTLFLTPFIGLFAAAFRGVSYATREKPDPKSFPADAVFHGVSNFLFVCSIYAYIAEVAPKKWAAYKRPLWVASAIPTAGALALDERKEPACKVKMSLYITGELVTFIAIGAILSTTFLEKEKPEKVLCGISSSFQLPLLGVASYCTHGFARTPEPSTSNSTEDRDISLPSFLRNPALEALEKKYIEPKELIEEIKSILLVQEGCANNVFLQGDSGSGKTAAVEYLAWQIKEKKDPRFKDHEVYFFNPGDLVAQGGIVGGIERGIKLLRLFIDEKAAQGKKVILFIDEIHQAVNGGATSAHRHGIDQHLLTLLTNPNLQVIGATTPDDFHHFEGKSTFLNRFIGIDMPPMEEELKKQIIQDLIKQYKLPDEFANDPIFRTGIPRDIRQILGLTATKIDCSGCQPAKAFTWAKSKATKTKKNLPSFIRDLTDEVEDKVYVEPKELVSEIETILLAQDGSANNVLLFGESGSGKTAAVEHLAWKIKQGQSGDFEGYKVYFLNARDLTAQGRGYLGDLERGIKRLQRFIDVQMQRGLEVILFIDEIHQLIGAGATPNSPHGLDQHLLTLLTNPHLRVIGATTPSDSSHFKGKEAFMNRFTLLKMPHLSEELKGEIIAGLLSQYGLSEDLAGNKVFQGNVPRDLHQILALTSARVKRARCMEGEALSWATDVAQNRRLITAVN